MVPLSEPTRVRILALFSGSDAARAGSILVEDCGDNLPLLAMSTSEGLERIRFAAIRLSGGRLDDLRKAVALANVDWRDLLVSAGFERDPEAHLRWQPLRFDADLSRRWMAGENLPGVTFTLHQPVSIATGLSSLKSGSVIFLLGLEPEPKYLVELGSGEDIEVFQRSLRTAE
jgi:hypothetical protein